LIIIHYNVILEKNVVLKIFKSIIKNMRKQKKVIQELKWSDNTYIFEFDKVLTNIEIPKNLSAIYHKDKNLLEFIFRPINKKERYAKRNFQFNYQGIKFNAYYAKPTKIFIENFIKGFKTVKKDDNFIYDTLYTSFRQFKDFYEMDKNTSTSIKSYFKNKTPINFFIEGDLSKTNDFAELCKTLNFYMMYYDRNTPIVIIDDKENEKDIFKESCHCNIKSFPEIIDGLVIDPILLEIFSVAAVTPNPMLKYLFYYQMLEYCSYYYLNDSIKSKILKILKNPDLLEKANDTTKMIIEESRNYVNDSVDSQKLSKIINDFCGFKDVKQEIEDNWEYFSKDIEFDGGFNLPAIINNKNDCEIPPKAIMDNIRKNIEKLRNVLVHLREMRENKTILPTPNNHNLLLPYLYLIRRIAEKIAIQFNQ